MTHYEFSMLPYEEKLGAILSEGTFLAQRWEAPNKIKLYHLDQFFVELYYNTHKQRSCVSSTSNSLLLGAYAAGIHLPKLS